MARIAVIGANGKTGFQVVTKALDAGHEVVAVVRRPEAFTTRHERLSTVQADVLDAASLAKLAEGEPLDHVVVALGSKDLWGNTVRSVGTGNVTDALKGQTPAPRVWVISAAGVGDSWGQLGFMSKLFAKVLLPSVMKEHALQEQKVQGSGLPFTVLRATGLADGDKPPGYVVVESGKLPGATIARSALAQCLVDHLSDEGMVGKAVTVTGA